MVPPRIAPVEPAPLTRPEAVEAPRLVPRSTQAVPLTSESGANVNNPMRKRLAPIIQRLFGRLSSANNSPLSRKRQITDTGIWRELKSLSDTRPPMITLNGPARSNIALRKPDYAMPEPA